MLEGLFDDGEEDFAPDVTGRDAAVQAHVQTYSFASRPAHCASNMDMPVMARQESNLCGLINQ